MWRDVGNDGGGGFKATVRSSLDLILIRVIPLSVVYRLQINDNPVGKIHRNYVINAPTWNLAKKKPAAKLHFYEDLQTYETTH
ncbi:hypothetical protein L1887_21015 [Cichorium endivia]|nr:hypothetical protein L1887_21015 [Cichorium endivia]